MSRRTQVSGETSICFVVVVVFHPTHNALLNTCDCLAVYISLLVALRKVSGRASCKALRWDKVITIRRVCICQYELYSRFILLNGSITLIRAETERHDMVRF